MKIGTGMLNVIAIGILLLCADPCQADWPQWRGLNRDARSVGFQTPESWPKDLKEKWKTTVGTGVATPALVGDRLYVFSRQEGSEVIRALDAKTGNELWQDKYESGGATGGASGFSGPRCSPAVAEGKIVALGVRGTLSCLDAATGKVLWRKDDFKGAVPMFYVASSPIIVDGLCIAELGGRGGGGIVAYDLAGGEQKWKWTGDGPAYGSPVLLKVGETKAIVAPTERKLVAIGAADGKVLWEVSYSQGRYNAATPLVDGQTLIYAGPNRGTTAETLDKQGDKLVAKELWKNEETSLQFNTPVLRDGLIFGLSSLNSLFCVDAENGKTLWTVPASGQTADAGAQAGGGSGRGFGRGGGGGGGYGSVVDAGTVLLALTPVGELIVFEPNAKQYKELARYKVADGNTYAYPIPSGKGIYIKDRETITLWTLE